MKFSLLRLFILTTLVAFAAGNMKLADMAIPADDHGVRWLDVVLLGGLFSVVSGAVIYGVWSLSECIENEIRGRR